MSWALAYILRGMPLEDVGKYRVKKKVNSNYMECITQKEMQTKLHKLIDDTIIKV